MKKTKAFIYGFMQVIVFVMMFVGIAILIPLIGYIMNLYFPMTDSNPWSLIVVSIAMGTIFGILRAKETE